MAEQNTIDIKTNIFTKKMVKDLHANFQDKETWGHALNAQVHSQGGDMFTISNEQSNKLCYQFESNPLGLIKLRDDRILIIQKSGEFGILNSNGCKYEKLFTINCKNIFDFTCKPILGRSRLINDLEEYVVFGNEDIPVGELNLSKIPYKYTELDDSCKTKEYTKEIDCEQLLQFKNINIPEIEIINNSNVNGSLADGAYQIAIAYSFNGEKWSDYYGLTNPIHIYNNQNNNGSIDIKINNLDRTYPEYQILVIQNSTINETSKTGVNAESYINIGTFSTSQDSVTISDIYGKTETSLNLFTNRTFPNKVGGITSNSEHLIYSNIESGFELDYQLQAMNIEVEYVIKQVPVDYYYKNFDFGFFGDENYAPYIRWYDKKGQVSSSYHIPGPKKTSKDSVPYNGDNLYENDLNLGICDVKTKYENWEINNTSGNMKPELNSFKCNERIIGSGKMGYFESDNKYPDNKLLYGDSSCTNIRYPKFPDECKVKRYEIIDNQTYINLKLWRFKNIPHPKDKKGNPILNIQGYEILRKTRNGGNDTVISAGYLSNMRGLEDKGRSILYQNYPFNDQSEDKYHSLTEISNKNNKERNYTPITQVYKDKLSYYTPASNYNLKKSLSQELKIYTEENHNVSGNFLPTHNHPKVHLATNFALYTSILLGSIQAYIELYGKTCKTTASQNETITSSSGVVQINGSRTLYEECEGILGTGKKSFKDILKDLGNKKKILLNSLRLIAKTVAFTTSAAKYADNWLNVIQNFSPNRELVYQNNSISKPNGDVKCINQRRFINDYQYINENNTEINNFIVNNELSNSFIFLNINKEVAQITLPDNSRNTISGYGLCKKEKKYNAQSTFYYGYNKRPNKNQYGFLDEGRFVKCHSNIIKINQNELLTYDSPIIAGGDCAIVRHSYQNKRQIFSTDFTNRKYPDNTYINYKTYRSLGYPRFWFNNDRFELSDIVGGTPRLGKMPSQRRNLDCFKNSKKAFDIKDEYMYSSVNGIVEMIVEADTNLSYRQQINHYSKDNTDINKILRSDNLPKKEEFKLSPSYFKLENSQISTSVVTNEIPSIKKERNAVIYSLAAYSNQKVNNWKYFLPNNYYNFDNFQFGNLTGIHQLDNEKIIFLFDKSSPYVSAGKSELQTSEETIVIGDGGLFARKPSNIMYTDVGYGSTSSPYSFLSTQFGYFYPSANQGRFLKFTNGLEDISRAGMHFWCKEFMPFKLKEFFTNYTKAENPLCGIGYISTFDNFYETLYFTKRDYAPLYDKIIYDDILDKFYYDGIEVSLKDTNYFEDISFTISYRPTNEGFISFHSWHPDLTYQLENHFLTVKDNGIWLHNDNCQSFCNFYGKDYGFEIEPIISNGQTQEILNSFEYLLEVYNHSLNCLDKYHVLKENFDKSYIYNSEQHSGILNLNTSTEVTYKNTYKYPSIITNYETDVLCIKKENKYRFNGFKDNLKDRGEQSGNKELMITNSLNGYENKIIKQNFDTNKKLRRFRHNWFKIRLIKEISKNNNYIFKFFNSKQNISIR